MKRKKCKLIVDFVENKDTDTVKADLNCVKTSDTEGIAIITVGDNNHTNEEETADTKDIEGDKLNDSCELLEDFSNTYHSSEIHEIHDQIHSDQE